MLPRLAVTLGLGAVLCPVVALAQQQAISDLAAPPAYVSVAEGDAVIEHDGRVETAPLSMPVLAGDRLRTTDGRLEVRFTDGSTLDLDRRTVVDMQSDALLRLVDGRVRLNALRAFRVDSAAGSARVADRGECLLAIVAGSQPGEPQLELAVVRGAAEIFTQHGSTSVRAGERAYASADLLPSYSYAFVPDTADDFDRWPEAPQDMQAPQAAASAQYLPPDLQGYSSTFDDYGDWRYAQPYGYVWYPRVAVGWRPYYYGRWISYPRYGPTWIGLDRFAWPTHHYGRWGLSAGVWFWIPASRWAPAYVSWAYAPDYVSWCPLGWNNRAIVSLDVVAGGSRVLGARPGVASAWTVVSRPYFNQRGRGFVPDHAVTWDRVQGRTFQESRNVRLAAAAPSPAMDTRARNVAVPRATAPPRDVSGRGGFYGSANPRYVNRGDDILQSRTARPVAPASAPRPAVRPDVTAVPRRTMPETPSYQSRPWVDAPRSSGPVPERARPRPASPAAYPSAAPVGQPMPRGYEPTRPSAAPPSRGYQSAPPPPQRTGPPAEHAAPRETAQPRQAPPAQTHGGNHRGRG